LDKSVFEGTGVDASATRRDDEPTPLPPNVMSAPTIFLSYRRHDAPGHAGRIYDRLVERFGPGRVFIDTTIPPGGDYVDAIERAMGSVDLLIALIGQRWAADAPAGSSPTDFVHTEIELAFEHGVPVIPVLVDGASMPRPDELPARIARLARINALEISDTRFDADMARLLDAVTDSASITRAAAEPGPARAFDEADEAQPAAGESVETRKTVTVLFSDLVSSTELAERLDPETLRRVMDRYFEEMRGVIARNGGTVEKYIGDAIMAVFGHPTLHEDDPLRAIQAAWEMRDALAELNHWLEERWGIALQARTGVNTGEVVTGQREPSHHLVVGDAVNTAARLEQLAPAGEILLGQTTHAMVKGAVEVDPVAPLNAKGKSSPVHAWRLLSAPHEPAEPARRSPLVGRDHEMTVLQQAFERSVADRSSYLFTLIGAAGVGKSRLVAEFVVTLVGRAGILRGRCRPYGETGTFSAIGQIVKSAAAISDAEPTADAIAKLAALVEGARDADLLALRVAQALGLESASSPPEEIFWSIRRLFEHLARDRPLVVVIEDIHWAEQTLLDLIEHVADWSREAPILLVCPTRHELLERRPSWAGGKLNATSIALEPLSTADGEALVRNLLGAPDLPPQVLDHVVNAAEGNPLFVEEMLGMLVDEGAIARDDGRWTPTRDLAETKVPPTISALLAARIDGLPEDLREVVRRASVAGREFHRGAVEELCPPAIRSSVAGALMALLRRELIRPAPSSFPGEDAFRFRHALIRDAGYQAMPKELRADLHERFAAWLERVAGDRVKEFEESIGYHLEQAHRYRAELGFAGDREQQLAESAAKRLASAGWRASARRDSRAAIGLLDRAAELSPLGTRRRSEILLSLAEAHADIGEFARAEEILKEILDQAEELGEPALEAYARLISLWIRLFTGPVDEAAVRKEVGDLIPMFEAQGDALGLARAWAVAGEIALSSGRAEMAGEAAQRGVGYASRVGHGMTETALLSLYATAGSIGPTPVPEALERCDEVLAQLTATPSAQAWVLRHVPRLLAMEGRFDEARDGLRRARAIMDEFGSGFILVGGLAGNAGYMETLAGDPRAAEDELRWGYEKLEGMGEKAILSSVGAKLATALATQGPERLEEARRFAGIAEEAGSQGQSSRLPQFEWRAARAAILLQEGRPEEAEAFAREAVTEADRTDFVNDRAEMKLVLGEVLLALGRPEAQATLEEALGLFEQKGNLVRAARAEALLDSRGAPA
jgi:class 3 adenylate cyclase/tetratricopeptide (TPR) repeat protein